MNHIAPSTAVLDVPTPITPARALEPFTGMGLSAEAIGQLSEMLFDPDRMRIAEQRRRPIAEHVTEYRAKLEERGKPKHVRDSHQRLRVIIEMCSAARYADLSKSKIEAAMASLRKANNKRGNSTVNHYFNSLKGFCNWMVEDLRAERSPCLGVKLLPPKKDVRHKRRRLPRCEQLRLLESANRGISVANIQGPERAVLYLLALVTGLRSKELLSLTRSSFHFDALDIDGKPAPYVRVEGEFTKNGEPACQPLGPKTVQIVRRFLHDSPRGPSETVLRRPKNAMRAMRIDLEAAKIEYVVNGEYADFHSLRHTFVSVLGETDATPKVLQDGARHSDVRLTLGNYSHASAGALREAIEQMPPLVIEDWADRTDAAAASLTQPGRMDTQHERTK